MTHPDDDDGDALRRLEANGDDLSRARNIDFTVVFADQSGAEKFAAHFQQQGYNVTVRYAQVKEAHPWDALVVKQMIPFHSGITNFEQELQEVADPLGGYNDGWGCIAQNALVVDGR